MSFGGNTTPRKKPPKPPGKPWVCKCKIQQPHYLVWCPKCGAGRS